MNPRRRCAPHSIDSSTEPPHSPPTPMPWKTRSTTSRIGAARPIGAWPGSTPMRRVAMPMISSVTTRVALRPTRSPTWPKMAAPTGRAAKPTNWVAERQQDADERGVAGKKTCGKTKAAAVPYRKKSYHSMVVPTVLATTARARLARRDGLLTAALEDTARLLGSVPHAGE